MGIAASWIGVRGLDRGEFLQRLRLTETGDTLKLYPKWFPRRCDGGVATLADGRQLFISSYADLAMPEFAERVSAGAQLVMCSMNEMTMFSEAFGYSDGRLEWLIRHDSAKDLRGVETTGDPPETLSAALAEADRRVQQDANVDFHFSVPMEIVGPIAGYRADDDCEGFDQEVAIVERKRKASLLRWLLGSF
jgi:hypothetical protein